MTKFAASLFMCFAATLSQAQVTMSSLAAEMLDPRALANLPRPSYTCAQFSSYDRASVSPTDLTTWFANSDVNQFIRVDETPTAGVPRKEWVMADAKGPGAVVRIWSPNPKGVLRIYLDHGAAPVIEAPMEALLAGRDLVGAPLAQSQSRGWNLYLPIPYAEHLRVTTDEPGSYYHVNYRTYEAGTAVTTLTRAQLENSKSTIVEWNERLAKPLVPTPALAGAPFSTLAPGAEVSGGIESGGGAVTAFAVALKATNVAEALRSVVLVAEFDGEQTVWCPVGDFFGTGTSFNRVQDWYRASGDGGLLTCRWVMPFQKNAKFTLRNLGKNAVDVKMDWTSDVFEWSERAMHFGAVWHGELGIRTRAADGTKDWSYATIDGQGVVVGDNLAVFNPVGAWWGEGDEKIYVDGEKFPSHFGTGTEDYYGYGWCDPVPFLHPLHAQVRCDGYRPGGTSSNRGNTFLSRLRALDAIPFTSQIRFDMEVWHWSECEVDFASTLYFYARPGFRTNREPQPDVVAVAPRELPPPFKVAGAIECEGLRPVARSSGVDVSVQGLMDIGSGNWSGDAQLFVRAREPGDFIELAIPAPSGRSKLTLYSTKSWDFGIVRFTVNGTVVGSDMDFYSGKDGRVTPTGAIDLGAHESRDGKILLRAELVGGNPASSGTKSFFGLDCVTLTGE